MNFCFPSKFPQIRIEKEPSEWWVVWINLPTIGSGDEHVFCDTNRVFKIEATTGFEIKKNEFWHSYKIIILGFGFGYARQWGY
jgi:hypothetical protein